ncbi:ribonuclease P protein subunit p20-like isoform X1 [Bacillus rossius redtenbacheri]|uniref:ribonuclease P protein subunit p20-like isoform X1 n=1 Tax=Bacillus rossius redtenbacheri TaxID=93214 RepID=UPI002FDEE4B3
MGDSQDESRLEQRFNKREKQKTDPDRILRKRLPPRLPRSDNHVYITNKTNYQAQLKRCEGLLERADGWLVIHGLGAAVSRALNLALQLQLRHPGTVQLAVNTSTTDLVDSLEPTGDQGDWEWQTRQNSSVHVKLWRAAQ